MRVYPSVYLKGTPLKKPHLPTESHSSKNYRSMARVEYTPADSIAAVPLFTFSNSYVDIRNKDLLAMTNSFSLVYPFMIEERVTGYDWIQVAIGTLASANSPERWISTPFVKAVQIFNRFKQLLEEYMNEYEASFSADARLVLRISLVKVNRENFQTMSEVRQRAIQVVGPGVAGSSDNRALKFHNGYLDLMPGPMMIWTKARSSKNNAVLDYLQAKNSIIVGKENDGFCLAAAIWRIIVKNVCHVEADKTQYKNTWNVQEVARFKRLIQLVYGGVMGLGAVVMLPKQGKTLVKGFARRKPFWHQFHEMMLEKTKASVETNPLKLYMEFLNVNIRVYDLFLNFKKVFDGGLGDQRLNIMLLRDGDHCHGILSLKALTENDNHCQPCDKLYDKTHKTCLQNCSLCFTKGCKGSSLIKVSGSGCSWRECAECRRNFLGEACFQNHLTETCALYRRCGKFGCKTFKVTNYPNSDWRTHHICGDKRCTRCGVFGPGGHRCFIQPEKKSRADPSKYLFFDVETEQSSGLHRVTHVVVADCTQAFEEFNVFQPESDGSFANVMDNFCDFLFAAKRFTGYTAIAHNGGGYDFHFIIHWCLNKRMPIENMIRIGSKVKSFEVLGVRFIDSYCFLPMALRCFTSTFKLKDKVKGFFPYLFNTPENQNYVGPLPEKAMFGEIANASNSKEFDTWYEEFTTSGRVFNLRHDTIAYCKSDVDLLRAGCLSFQSSFIATTERDPFESITIASACLKVFRQHHLVENSIALLTPLEDQFCRRGFFGGRTCVFKAQHTCVGSETIKYIDIMSLYPWVNFACEYPMGDPVMKSYEPFGIGDRLIHFEEDITRFLGYFEVDVICPPNLLIPLLPRKQAGNLIFSLEPIERGVFASPELRLALELGYVVTNVYNSILWPDRSVGLSSGYVKRFLKVKQEASGWDGKLTPDGKQVETDEEKAAWVVTYAVKSGIDIDVGNVEFNPGNRTVSKLCLNSFWGKLCQRSNMVKTEFTDDQKQVINLLESKDVQCINEYKCEELANPVVYDVSYKTKSIDVDAEQLDLIKNTNVGVAAFTTAHARIRLFRTLHILGDRVLYCDTDSIMYTHAEGESTIELGDNLGDWEDEVSGDPIIDYVAVGPKMYGYRTRSGKTTTRSKGFSNNKSSAAVIDFENFKRAILSQEYESTVKIPIQITRNKRTYEVENKVDGTKRFRPTVTLKGVYDDDTKRLYPFGYEDLNLSKLVDLM